MRSWSPLTSLGLPLLAAAFLLVGTSCSSNEPRERPHGHSHGHDHGHHHDHGDGDHHGDHATVHHRFDDAEKWAARFEDPARDAWQQPERVLEWLELEPNHRVADIGAATGYFPIRIAPHVPQGVVYGVDVEPNLMEFLAKRAEREGHGNVRTIVCAPADPKLPEAVDRVIVVNTYHHIGDRRRYFGELRQKLRANGQLMIVDFKKGDWPVGPGDDHKIMPEQVEDELSEAGYRCIRREELPYQYVRVFEAR